MFEFDAGKLILIGIVALIVIGPKELPGVLRQVGLMVGKMRRMAAEFQGQFMEAMREAEIADIKGDMTRLAEKANADMEFNPLAEIKAEITKAIESPREPVKSSEATGAIAGAGQAPAQIAPQLPGSGLSEAPENELTLLGEGIAPAAPELGGDACESPQPSAIAAGMRALADALKAEMEPPEPQPPDLVEPDKGSKGGSEG